MAIRASIPQGPGRRFPLLGQDATLSPLAWLNLALMQWLNSAGTGRSAVPQPVSGVPLPETAVPPPEVVVPPPGDAVLYFVVS